MKQHKILTDILENPTWRCSTYMYMYHPTRLKITSETEIVYMKLEWSILCVQLYSDCNKFCVTNQNFIPELVERRHQIIDGFVHTNLK